MPTDQSEDGEQSTQSTNGYYEYDDPDPSELPFAPLQAPDGITETVVDAYKIGTSVPHRAKITTNGIVRSSRTGAILDSSLMELRPEEYGWETETNA